MSAEPKTKAQREERERLLLLKHKMDNRITTTRFGKEALDIGDYGSAIRHFNDYLMTIAEAKGVGNIYSLRPNHFDTSQELTEMLMLSHVFFEMARIYDASPKFAEEARKSLDQFINFSVNQPFQVVNSELIRKYLKKSVFKNPEMFRNAHQQIHVQSKKCYIVTFCYGEEHPVTAQYRLLKDRMLDYRIGQEFVRYYYAYSSRVVTERGQSRLLKIIATYFVAPILLVFSKTLLRFILK